MAKDKKIVGKILEPRDVKRRYPGAGLASKILCMPEDSLWLPSRYLHLNHSMGGGIPYGKILEIAGEESSGKTLLSLDFAYCAQALDGVVLYGDAERSLDRFWAELNGLDLSRIDLYPENRIEVLADWLLDMGVTYRAKLNRNQPILFILDSIAATEKMEAMGVSQADASSEMGNRAKALDTMLRRRNQAISDLGIACIFINQLRSKIGATKYEDPDTTPGGKAMAFYASQRLRIYSGKSLKGQVNGTEDLVGKEVSIRIRKNKVAPPKPTIKGAEVYFNADYCEVGFNKYKGLAEMLVARDVLVRKRGGAIYKFEGSTIAKGEENMEKLLLEDDELRSKLVKASGVNTISLTRAKIENIESNLYPVKVAKKKEEEEDNE